MQTMGVGFDSGQDVQPLRERNQSTGVAINVKAALDLAVSLGAVKAPAIDVSSSANAPAYDATGRRVVGELGGGVPEHAAAWVVAGRGVPHRVHHLPQPWQNWSGALK